MKPLVYVFLAPSRSGKDSLAEELYQILPPDSVRLYKWAAPFKRVVEGMYGLKPYSLEDEDIRNSIIPGTKKTYLDLMVNFYHIKDQLVDSSFWERPTFKLLEQAKEQQKYHLMFTDTRSKNEVDAIVDLVQNSAYELVLVRLYRANNKGLSSDLLLDRNHRLLFSHALQNLTYHIPDSDDYMKHIVPIAMELSKLASREQ